MLVLNTAPLQNALKYQTSHPLHQNYIPAAANVFNALKEMNNFIPPHSKYHAGTWQVNVPQPVWDKFAFARNAFLSQVHVLAQPSHFHPQQDIQAIQQFAHAVQAVQPQMVVSNAAVVPSPIFVKPVQQYPYAQSGIHVPIMLPNTIVRNLFISGSVLSGIGLTIGLIGVFLVPPLAFVGLILLVVGLVVLAGGLIKKAIDAKKYMY